MNTLFSRLSLFSFLLLIAASCSDDSTTDSIPETGTFEMTFNSQTWTATEASAFVSATKDSSALIIGASNIPEDDSNPVSAVTIIVVNTTSGNLVGNYSMNYEYSESESETEPAKAAFLTYTDGTDKFWVCTSGSFKITKAKDKTVQGTFEGVLTEMTDMYNSENSTESPFSIPKFKLGTRQLNATLTIKDGGFNLNYISATDMEFDY